MINHNLKIPFEDIEDLFKDISNIVLFNKCVYYPDILQYQELFHPMLRLPGPATRIAILLLPYYLPRIWDTTRARLFFNMLERTTNEKFIELLNDSRSYLICLFIFHNSQFCMTPIRLYELKEGVVYFNCDTRIEKRQSRKEFLMTIEVMIIGTNLRII